MDKRLSFVAMAGSAGLLIAALGFQYLGGLHPCDLCIQQRWPHVVAVVAGLLVLAGAPRLLGVVGFLGAMTSGAIGIYHTGAERKWWQGPSTCTSGDISNMSVDELFASIEAAPLIRCDEVVWELFTLSMASWNAVISFGIALLWVLAMKKRS